MNIRIWKTGAALLGICGMLIVNGCGASEQNAAQNGADVFVSSDLKHHEIAALIARGLNVIELTHYSAESYGFCKIYQKIKDELNIPSAYFCDAGLL